MWADANINNLALFRMVSYHYLVRCSSKMVTLNSVLSFVMWVDGTLFCLAKMSNGIVNRRQILFQSPLCWYIQYILFLLLCFQTTYPLSRMCSLKSSKEWPLFRRKIHSIFCTYFFEKTLNLETAWYLQIIILYYKIPANIYGSICVS